MVPWLKPSGKGLGGVGGEGGEGSKMPAKITWEKGGGGAGWMRAGGVGWHFAFPRKPTKMPTGRPAGDTISVSALLDVVIHRSLAGRPAGDTISVSALLDVCQGPPGLPEPPPPPTILPACAPEIRLDFLVLLLCCVFSTNPSFELLQGGGSSKCLVPI